MVGPRHARMADTLMKNVQFALFSLWRDSWKLLWFYLVPERLLLASFISSEWGKKVTKTKQTDKNYMLKKIKKKSRVQDQHFFFSPREYLWTEQKCFWGRWPVCCSFFFLSACFPCLKLGTRMRLQQRRSSKNLYEGLQRIFLSFEFWVKIKSGFVFWCFVFGFVLVQPNNNHLPDSDSVVPGPSWNWLFGVVMLGPLCL